jgi:hypothetical protein
VTVGVTGGLQYGVLCLGFLKLLLVDQDMKLVPGASLRVVQISCCVRVTVVFHPSGGLADDSHIKLWGAVFHALHMAQGSSKGANAKLPCHAS